METTNYEFKPSQLLNKDWRQTFGKMETEFIGAAIPAYLSAQGDEWKEIPARDFLNSLRELEGLGSAKMMGTLMFLQPDRIIEGIQLLLQKEFLSLNEEAQILTLTDKSMQIYQRLVA